MCNNFILTFDNDFLFGKYGEKVSSHLTLAYNIDPEVGHIQAVVQSVCVYVVRELYDYSAFLKGRKQLNITDNMLGCRCINDKFG